MIDKENYSEEHIKALKLLSGANEDIIERTLFAFGLLEATHKQDWNSSSKAVPASWFY